MGTTKIILKKDIPTLGEEGDIKVVKNGFARNYLYPQGLAVDYSLRNKNILEKQKDILEKKKLAKKENAKSLKEKLETEKISLTVPAGDKGKLYGTVTSMQIEEQIKAIGYEIDKKQIEVKDHIKTGGKYKFTVHLYNDIYAEMELEVIPKQEEKKQDQKHSKKRRRFDENKQDDVENTNVPAEEAQSEEQSEE